MISFLQSKNLSPFSNLEHGFLKKDQSITPPPIVLNQIHSSIVVTIEAPLSEALSADGMVTRLTHLPLGIITADCVPVLLFDPEACVIGALHAGWKGALQGICKNGIMAMENLGARKSRIIATIGPSICQENYEVGPELKASFQEADPSNLKFFIPSSKEDHFLLNLKGYVCKRLEDAGVSNIEILPFNTYASPHLFHSYRRATHEGISYSTWAKQDRTKRSQMSFIKLK